MATDGELLNKIPPLRGSENWRQWRRNIKLALFAHNLDSFIQDTTADPPHYPSKVRFEREEARALLLIRCNCTEQVLRTLPDSDNLTARQLWDHLTILYGQPSDTWFTAYERFYDLRYNKGDPQDFVRNFKLAWVRCQDQNFAISENLAVFHLLKLLDHDFPEFVQAKCSRLRGTQSAPSLNSVLDALLKFAQH